MPRKLLLKDNGLNETGVPVIGKSMGYYGNDYNSSLSQWDSSGQITGVVGYKSYIALISQDGSGSSNPGSLSSGNLTVGVSYEITNYQIGDDFTNVGASSNANGVKFMATGTTPNVWTNSSQLSYDFSFPTAVVLENTVGNISFYRDSKGLYVGSCVGAFTADKSVILFGTNTAYGGGKRLVFGSVFIDVNTFHLYIGEETTLGSSRDLKDGLTNSYLEIRVYN